MNSKNIIVIGSGIAGLASACLLARKGHQVTVLEKNHRPGGRANIFNENGFVFDMGPSWYMMPDIFEHFFSLMGEDINDHLELKRLDPSYRIFLEGQAEKKVFDLYSDLEKNIELFESIETGAGEKLREYIKMTGYQYHIAKNEFMFKNYNTIFDFINRRVMTEGRKLPLFSKVESIINKRFKNDALRKILQFQTVLLGTAPADAPGIYSMMNYVDFVGGVWYPDGGLYRVIEAIINVAEKHKVEVKTNSPIKRIIVEKGEVWGVELESGLKIKADIVISNADIVHTDQKLLPPKYRLRSDRYWNSRIMAPSAFIMYLGVKGKIDSLSHHNLLFSANWHKNFDQIFKTPQWPEKPSLYICVPSKTDPQVAPLDHENLFVLVPTGAGLDHNENFSKDYSKTILELISQEMNIPDLQSRVVYQKTYTVKDFTQDYNSFKGSALGLAHTLSQTAVFRPNNINKKVKGLYYAGAGTNPGIGLPIGLISAELVYKRIEGITNPAPLDTLNSRPPEKI